MAYYSTQIGSNSPFINLVKEIRLSFNDYDICKFGHVKPSKVKRNSIPGALRHEVFKRDNYHCVECGATNKKN